MTSLEKNQYIQANYPAQSIRQIASHLQIHPNAVGFRLKQLGLRRPNPVSLENKELRKQGKNRCPTCSHIYPYTDEYFNYHKVARHELYSICKKCRQASYLKRSLIFNTPEKFIGEKLRKIKNMYDQFPVIFNNKRLEVTLAEALEIYNKQQGCCYYSGVQLTLVPKCPETLSIDRIDSKKPYSKDNIVFCAQILNKMKMNLSKVNFVKWCKLVATAQTIMDEAVHPHH